MTMKPSKEDLQAFHGIDRRLFARLVFRLGRDLSLVMRVMALWLWLEEVGYPSVILALMECPDNLLIEVFHEGITMLRVLLSEVSSFMPSEVATPKTFRILGEQISLTTLHEHRAMALHGISETIRSVCSVAFGDNFPNPPHTAMVPMLPASELVPPPPPPPPAFAEGTIRIPVLPSIPHAHHPAWRPTVPFRGFLPIVFHPLPSVPPPFLHTAPWTLMPRDYAMGESSYQNSMQRLAIMPPPQDTNMELRQINFEVGESSSSIQLQQNAPTVPVGDRTMFVTFSRGFPVSESELYDYLTRTYGDVVEYIFLAETLPDVQPLWARVVFHSTSTVEEILQGEEKVRFVIKGKHVWTRRWIQN